MMDEVDQSDPSLPLQELSLALAQTPPQQGISSMRSMHCSE